MSHWSVGRQKVLPLTLDHPCRAASVATIRFSDHEWRLADKAMRFVSGASYTHRYQLF